MKTILTLLVISLSINSFCQPYFTGVYGDGGNNLMIKYAHSENGAFIYGAGFEGTVVKYSADGELVFMKKVDPAIYFYDFAETNDNSLLVAGMMLVGGVKQTIVAKLSSEGYIQWVKLFESGNRQMQQQIVKPTAGVDEFILASWYLNSGSDDDISLSKIDENGSVLWNYRYDYTDDQNDGIVPDGEGGVLVVGQSAGGDGEGNIMAVDSLGNFLWSKSFGSLPYAFHKVIKASDGSIYIAGDDYNEADTGKRNPILLKLNSSYEFEWMRELHAGAGLGTYPITGGADVAEDNNGDIYLSSVIFFDDIYQQAITKFSSTGNTIWIKTMGYTKNTEPFLLRISTYFNGINDYLNITNSRDDDVSEFGLNDAQLLNIATDGASCYLDDIDFEITSPSLIGFNEDYVRNDVTFTINDYGFAADSGQWNETTCDIFESIFSQATILPDQLIVTPNPAGNFCTIENIALQPGNSPIEVILSDLSGKIVYTAECISSGNKIFLKDLALPPGIYLVRLFANQSVQSTKLVIAK